MSRRQAKPRPRLVSPAKIDEQLQALYAQVPEVPCTGACHGACCFAPASTREKVLMERASGRRYRTIDAHREAEGGMPLVGANGGPLGDTRVGQDGTFLGRHRCSMLTGDGRCRVHEQRPMICRLYGAAEGLECHAGCKPDGGLLPFAEGMRLLAEAMRVGGEDSGYTAEDVQLLERLVTADRAQEFRVLLDGLRREGNWRVNH